MLRAEVARTRSPSTSRAGRARGPAHDAAADAFDLLARRLGVHRDRVIEEWHERAAIRQHLGGHAIADAERLGLTDAEHVLISQPPLF